jgi:alpha-tubulin suppressor-like RCC1 family protein
MAQTIAESTYDSLFIAANGKVYGLGKNNNGEITGTGPRSTPKALTGLPPGVHAVSVSDDEADTLVLGSDGKAYGAGYNSYDELTGASLDDKTTLTPLTGLPKGVKATAVASGDTHSLVLGSDGKVYGSGDNSFDQLTGAPMTYTTLTALSGPGASHVIAIAAGDDFSVVLDANGKVYGTGANFAGELTGSTSSQGSLFPFQDMPAGVRITAISAGESNTLMLGANEVAYAVGSNMFGQLDFDSDASAHPVPVSLPVSHVVAISAGSGNFAMIDKSGDVYAIGQNTNSQLTGTVEPVIAPTKMMVAIPSYAGHAVEVDLGWDSALVRNADGVVLGAGRNDDGRLTGSTTPETALTVLAGQKLINYRRPSISGHAKVGKTLRAHVGRWSVVPKHFAYQWFRGAKAIRHATKSGYKLTKKDKGKFVKVKVIGTRAGGFATGAATSARRGKVKP